MTEGQKVKCKNCGLDIHVYKGPFQSPGLAWVHTESRLRVCRISIAEPKKGSSHQS